MAVPKILFSSITTSTVDTNVSETVITSSPFPTPRALIARYNASEPEFTETANFVTI